MDSLIEKLDQLKTVLKGYKRCLIAYSGGVDSVFLSYVAHQVLGDQSLAVIADSPSLAREELKEALEISEQFKFPVRVIQTEEFENEFYLKNAPNRCYFCKSALFEKLKSIVDAENYDVIAYGENLDDVGDIRPGAVAAEKYSIQAPLKQCQFSKADVREASRQMGLPTAEKPQMACLSSRIPHGDPVTEKKLKMVEQSELFLKKLGFYGPRVRCHELSFGFLARIEIQPGDWKLISNFDLASEIDSTFKGFGFCYSTFDLGGYKRGGRSTQENISGRLKDKNLASKST